MALFIVSIVLGLLIVAVAVGFPYWRTHQRMREPYGTTEARSYFDAKDKAGEGCCPASPPGRRSRSRWPPGRSAPRSPRNRAPLSRSPGSPGRRATASAEFGWRMPGGRGVPGAGHFRS